jgi:hypothetical protein
MEIINGIFILTVSLGGTFYDKEVVGGFDTCSEAIEYKLEHYPEHKAARCLLKDVHEVQKDNAQ